MLILSRKLNESIVIDGRITVKVMRVDGDVVKLGIAAPAEIPVHRQEVYEEIRRNNQEAMTAPHRFGAQTFCPRRQNKFDPRKTAGRIASVTMTRKSQTITNNDN